MTQNYRQARVFAAVTESTIRFEDRWGQKSSLSASNNGENRTTAGIGSEVFMDIFASGFETVMSLACELAFAESLDLIELNN